MALHFLQQLGEILDSLRGLLVDSLGLQQVDAGLGQLICLFCFLILQLLPGGRLRAYEAVVLFLLFLFLGVELVSRLLEVVFQLLEYTEDVAGVPNILEASAQLHAELAFQEGLQELGIPLVVERTEHLDGVRDLIKRRAVQVDVLRVLLLVLLPQGLGLLQDVRDLTDGFVDLIEALLQSGHRGFQLLAGDKRGVLLTLCLRQALCVRLTLGLAPGGELPKGCGLLRSILLDTLYDVFECLDNCADLPHELLTALVLPSLHDHATAPGDEGGAVGVLLLDLSTSALLHGGWRGDDHLPCCSTYLEHAAGIEAQWRGTADGVQDLHLQCVFAVHEKPGALRCFDHHAAAQLAEAGRLADVQGLAVECRGLELVVHRVKKLEGRPVGCTHRELQGELGHACRPRIAVANPRAMEGLVPLRVWRCRGRRVQAI
mmetsp:Transcript_103180/g.330811  ORF Transcript_103180/g.330811 Transcript_103180/m.330811 type:complete len:431 (+) Transcript_103180:1560-2852(+)